MFKDIPEPDWKLLRAFHDVMLELCSKRNNDVIRGILSDQSMSEYDRYLAVYRKVESQDKIVEKCFNDWRRSRAHLSILALRHFKLMSDDQFALLSEETRAFCEQFQKI
jgi:hypothetical protein